MLRRLKELAAARRDFAFETTLAGRSFAPWLVEQIQAGYKIHVVFLWLPNAEAAVERVRERVRRGGHEVPESTVRRRYRSGLINFFHLYRALATSWQIIHNGEAEPRMIAVGTGNRTAEVFLEGVWRQIQQQANHAN